MRNIILLAVAAFFLSGCTKHLVLRNAPAELVGETLMKVEIKRDETGFSVSEIQSDKNGRPFLDASATRQTKYGWINIKELKYLDGTNKYHAGDLFGRSEKNYYIYVNGNVSFNDLIVKESGTPLNKDELLKAKVRYNRGEDYYYHWDTPLAGRHIKNNKIPRPYIRIAHSGGNSLKLGRFSAYAYSKDGREFGDYFEKRSRRSYKEKNQIIDQRSLRKSVIDFVRQNPFFDEGGLKTERKQIASPEVKIYQKPDWLRVSSIDKDKGVRVFLSSKEHTRVFSKSEGLSKVNAKYRYLFDNFSEKKKVLLGLTVSGSPEVNRELVYYDISAVLGEIKRIESLGYGFIKVTANKPGVAIFVDGQMSGVVEKGKPFVAKLTEGRHRIQAKKNFFGSQTITVNVAADDALAYNFDLKPAGNLHESVESNKIVQSTGDLRVFTTRNDLKVKIDGVARIPPFRLPNISSGIYYIHVIGPGVSKTFKLNVDEGKIVKLDLDSLIGS